MERCFKEINEQMRFYISELEVWKEHDEDNYYMVDREHVYYTMKMLYKSMFEYGRHDEFETVVIDIVKQVKLFTKEFGIRKQEKDQWVDEDDVTQYQIDREDIFRNSCELWCNIHLYSQDRIGIIPELF